MLENNETKRKRLVWLSKHEKVTINCRNCLFKCELFSGGFFVSGRGLILFIEVIYRGSILHLSLQDLLFLSPTKG
jgi:hypothetical protein